MKFFFSSCKLSIENLLNLTSNFKKMNPTLRNINVSISTDELKQALLKCFAKHEHKEIIVNVIIGTLNQTEIGLSHLYKALLGVEPQTKLKIGDKVLANFYTLPTWRMDKDKTLASGLIDKNDNMVCTVMAINNYKSDNIEIEMTYMNSKEDEFQKDTYPISDDKLTLIDESFPEDAYF